MLTARREEQDRIRGLSLGADDYLTKPFSPQELVLRVGAILRRVDAPAASAGGHPDASARSRSTARRIASRSTASEVELTPTEFKLLLTLAERRGRVQSARTCSRRCGRRRPTFRRARWTCTSSGCAPSSGDAGDLIETVRGFGYRLKSGQAARGT